MIDKQQLLDRIDIVEYFTSEGAVVKKKGAEYKTCCLLHNEKTPSFTINAEKKLWNCFGCGKSGDVFTFEKEMYGLNFPQAIKKLGDRYGVYDLEGELDDVFESKPMPPKKSFPIELNISSIKRGVPSGCSETKTPTELSHVFGMDTECGGYQPLPPGHRAGIVDTKNIGVGLSHLNDVTTGSIGTPCGSQDIEWVYTDKDGNPLYKKVRHNGDKRQTRQYHLADGEWKMGLKGVVKTLYNLQELLETGEVCLCEGEKDVDTLNSLGHIAVTAGGSNDWKSQFSESFRDKGVILFSDNDKPGSDLRDQILQDLKGVVKWVKVVSHPQKFKDITDYLDQFTQMEEKADELNRLINGSGKLNKGFTEPLYSVEEQKETYREYIEFVHKTNASFDLGDVFPVLKDMIKPRMPGEFISITANTGTGKTALLQNIISKINIPTLFCQLELSVPRMFQRSMQIGQGVTGSTVWNDHRNGRKGYDLSNLSHSILCECPGLTIEKLYHYYDAMYTKYGWYPQVVYVDYLQLMTYQKTSQYERLSAIARELKTFANKKKIIVCAISQISNETKRREFSQKQVDAGLEQGELFLEDAKGAGDIGDSSQLALGLWRTSKESATLKILKDGDGGSTGEKISLDFDGPHLTFKQEGHYGERL